MKSIGVAAGVLMCVVLLGAAGFAGGESRAKRAALIGDLDRGTGVLWVIGAYVSDRGWLSSKDASGLMHKGDEVAVLRLTAGRIGTAKLTNNGTLDSDFSQGLWYRSEPIEGDELGVALWHSRGSPAPKWVRVREFSTGNTVYRKVISEWLKGKGVAGKTAESVVVEQVVQADINGDKRDEVFLSFRTPNTPGFDWVTKPTEDTFSYLLMRYLPRGSRQAKTVIIEEFPSVVHRVTALCDLDNGGWAEVATSSSGVDVWGSALHHWTGGRFRRVGSWGGGC
ncbi:MAG: hypothetical protein ACE149_17020 [Armatimonadota bacterium]